MKKLYAALRLLRRASLAIMEEQRRPAADTPERRDMFARVDRLAERLGRTGPVFDSEPLTGTRAR